MSLHLNLSTGKFLNSSTLFKLSDALVLDVSSGEIVMSNLLVPRAVSVSSSPTLFGDATLDLNFANNLSLTDSVSSNNLVTFSRASTGTYVGSDGLIEESSTNLQYPSIPTISVSSTVTTNAAVSPDGTTTATFVETDGSTSTGVRSNSSITKTATYYAHSFYFKPGGYNVAGINYGSGIPDNYAEAWIDVTTGSSFVSSIFVSVSSTSVGNGWYRIFALQLPTIAGTTPTWGKVLSTRPDVPTGTNQTFTPTSSSGGYFWGHQEEIGSTATTYIPTTTTIGGAPRFDHDPVTLQSLGLLIEESRTNLVLHSEDFSDSYWGETISGNGVSPSITSNHAIAPDGTLTADKIDFSRGSVTFPNLSFVSSGSLSVTQGSSYSGSLWVKAATSGDVGKQIVLRHVSSGAGIIHTLTLDWERINSIEIASSVNPKLSFGLLGYDPSAYGSQTQPETSLSVHVWGAQVEESSFPTSYIPTTTATVTRAADVATIEGTNFSSWYNQSKGTYFVNATTVDSGTSDAIIDDGFVRITDYVGGGIRRRVANSIPGTFDFNPAQSPVNKTAIAFNSESANAAFAGAIQTLDTSVSGLPNSATSLIIGGVGAAQTNRGHISRLAYFPTRKTDEDLTSLTLPTAITYGITSPGGEFNLRSSGTVDYEVEWELGGSREASTLNVLPHTYAAGDYELSVYSDTTYRPYFANVTADVSQITSVVIGSGAQFGTSLSNAWLGATNMTSFVCPFDATSGVTGFQNTWFNCSSLTSFPLIDASSVTTLNSTWYFCSNLTDFPPNMFDTTGTLGANSFINTWHNCALTAQSIENILVSLDTNGATGSTLGINGGTNAAKTTWSAAAVTAYDNLIVKGWSIAFNA